MPNVELRDDSLLPRGKIRQLRAEMDALAERLPRERTTVSHLLDALLVIATPMDELHRLVPGVMAREPLATQEFIALLEEQRPRAEIGARALDEHEAQWSHRGGTGSAGPQPAQPGRDSAASRVLGAASPSGFAGAPRITTSGAGPMRSFGTGIPLPEPSGGRTCGLVPFDRLAGIGVATLLAGASVLPGRRQGLMDAVTGMGLCLGALESLYDAVAHHDLDRLTRRTIELTGGWLGQPMLPRDVATDVLPGPTLLADGRPLGPGDLRDVGLEQGRPWPGPGGGIPWPDPGGPPVPGGDPWGGIPRPPLGPTGGPDWCPPVHPERCEIEREWCWTELMHELSRGGLNAPRNDYVHADGITGIEPSPACAGQPVAIVGGAFGTTQPPGIEVRVRTARGCVAAQVVSWSDDRIEIVLPDDVTSSCVGFFDPARAAEAEDATNHLNGQLDSINSWLQCLRMSTIPRVPGPRLDDCPPCTGDNALLAGPPVITMFQIIVTMSQINGPNDDDIVVLPGQQVTLRWLVANADTITIRRTSNVGPTFGGATTVTNPPGGSFDLGVAAHTTPQLWTYELEATNACGTVTAQTSAVATADPALEIAAIEVTQGIQTPDHDVRLVRGKQGVIRVTPSHGLGSFGGGRVPGVTGRLRLRTGTDAWSPWFDPINGSNPATPTPGASVTVVGSPDREATDDTLNFLLPVARARGPLAVEVELRVDDYGAPAGRRGASSRPRRAFGPFAFHQRARIDLRYVRIRWQNGAAATPQTPTDAACVETLERSMRRMPARLGVIERVPGVGVQVAEVPTGATNAAFNNDVARIVRELVDEFDDQHNCSVWEWLTQWLGSDCPEDDGAYWALITGGPSGGVAAGIPSNTYLTPVNDENRAPHELGHSLGQLHIEVACPNGRQAGGGEPPENYANDGQLTDVAFDLDLNQTVTDLDEVWDIMTYCGTRWTKPQRSQQLFDHIGS